MFHLEMTVLRGRLKSRVTGKDPVDVALLSTDQVLNLENTFQIKT
jgi:hypothetical protein